MIKNYFLVAWRNLVKNKVLSVIKIAGLSIGLTVCILIFLYSKDEISFDQFHANKENIYRVYQRMRMGNNPPFTLSIAQPVWSEAFRDEIPEVTVRVRQVKYPVTTKKGNDVFTEEPLFADKNFFSVFSFQLLNGNPQTALNDMYSIVLSKTIAKKYFGEEDPKGKIMQIRMRDEFENFTVSGVASDPPQNSTITFDMLIPLEFYLKDQIHTGWLGGSVNTFLVLDPKADRKVVTNKMQAVFDKNTRAQIEKMQKEQGVSGEILLGIQPITDVHVNKELGAHNGLAEVSSPQFSYLLSSIAIFILLIACINFINLSIGQSLKRSREIGIRKVVGGNRKQLIWQFLAESFVISLIAFVLAITLAFAILPFFNDLAGKKLSLTYLADGWLYLGWFVLLLATSFIAGFYPSLVLSSFQPLRVLSGKEKLMGKNYFARGLIVFQFALAIFLIIGTIAVYTQLNYLFNKDLGYDKENLVKIALPPFSKDNPKLIKHFKHDLASQSEIVNIGTRNLGRSITGVVADAKQFEIDINSIDENFFPTFKIPFRIGRNFSSEFPADSVQSAIVNETFLKEAGWNTENALGKSFKLMEEDKTLTIVGVAKDYHFKTLKEKTSAQLFTMGPESQYGEIWVKIKPENVPGTVALLSKTFRDITPFVPFSYDFMNMINAKNYEREIKWKQIVGISAILFIFISCIGMLGLVMLSVEQRTKEIGIRKVLGAAVFNVLVLVSKEFTVLVLIAFVVAIPAGYYAINFWLQDFPYRTTIQWWMFALGGLTAILLALITISFQAVKAALANPVKSLRTE